jgi:hypothetical protein
MRHVPKNCPVMLLLHVGNASLEQKSITWAEVARPERSADTECGALLGRGMRRCHNLEAHAGQGGTPGTYR